ncbi:MAG: bis(5'-nucleosyl)-tetraphosphatase (symmetrical) YqeK [Spirochaetales bacterium]|nr:bis(5'-nucleosyl)-tetraphosphatase (symmetrical) YqeK [Spirochaetales bacterium]
MSEIIEELRAHLRRSLSAKRFRHCEGTERASLSLAEKFMEDQHLCALAGLGHDICREYSGVDLKNITGKDHEHPILLHGEAGALVLERDFGIKNASVLKAVRHHISGGPGLDKVGKILFAADYMEDGRTHLSRQERERLFSLDLDDMVLSIALSIRSHLEAEEMPLEPALMQMIEELS